jgi:hypothetical protein
MKPGNRFLRCQFQKMREVMSYSETSQTGRFFCAYEPPRFSLARGDYLLEEIE